MSGRILTVNEVSRHCSVPIETVLGWVDEGKLPVFKTPAGHRHILRIHFLEFIQKEGLPIPSHFQPAPHKRVLEVDDDRQIVFGLTRFIKRMDRSILVEAAYDGEEACRKFATFKPHLVILDLIMPDLNGFSVCKIMRSKTDIADAKILAFSGQDNSETRNNILSCGADDFLGKPFAMEALNEKISSLLEL